MSSGKRINQLEKFLRKTNLEVIGLNTFSWFTEKMLRCSKLMSNFNVYVNDMHCFSPLFNKRSILF